MSTWNQSDMSRHKRVLHFKYRFIDTVVKCLCYSADLDYSF